MIKKIALILLATVAMATAASAQMLLSGFTFEASAPTTAGPFNAESGTGTATGVHAGASTYSSPAGNGSTHSYSSNTWAVGDYYQFTLTNVTATELFVTFGAYSSSTGPLNFALTYSVNGNAFSATTSNTYNVGPTSFATATYQSGDEKSFDITGIAANGTTIAFRLVNTTTTSANLTTPGTVAATGTSRVDDFNVSTGGYVYPAASVPEPSTAATMTLGSLGVLALLRSRRRTA